MASQAIKATAKQFARNEIIKTGNHHSDAQICGIGETPFKNGHKFSNHKNTYAPINQYQSNPCQSTDKNQAIAAAAVVIAGIKHWHCNDQHKRHHHQRQNSEGIENLHGEPETMGLAFLIISWQLGLAG
jgi:hypothetical protein